MTGLTSNLHEALTRIKCIQNIPLCRENLFSSESPHPHIQLMGSECTAKTSLGQVSDIADVNQVDAPTGASERSSGTHSRRNP